jgi:glycyl-tRNA synthetase
MFKTFIGPVEEEAAIVYLRPETAQGMFVNFQNAVGTSRKRLPFGIAQIGKAFRNEITTGNFIFRSREFEQMEIEYFVKPGTDDKWFDYWLEQRFNWYVKYGIDKEHLKLDEHPKEKLAHYAQRCCDITYQFPMDWAELEGIANRTDFDLKQHSEASGKSMEYYDDETKEHYIPYIIEPLRLLRRGNRQRRAKGAVPLPHRPGADQGGRFAVESQGKPGVNRQGYP